MAKYREKDAVELAWNRTRRNITRALDTAIMNRREDMLNMLLPAAFEEFTSAVAKGQVIEFEARYQALANAIVEDVLESLKDEIPTIEAIGNVAND